MTGGRPGAPDRGAFERGPRRIARALQTVPPDELPNTAGATVEAAVWQGWPKLFRPRVSPQGSLLIQRAFREYARKT